MNSFSRQLGFAVAALTCSASLWAQTPKAPSHRAIVGWDDAVITCGPGTTAGMDSPEAMRRMVKRWKARGLDGVYWRVDEAMLPPEFMKRWHNKQSPSLNYLMHRIDDTLENFPLLPTLLEAANEEGVGVWAWYPTILSNGAPPTGPNFTQAWLYESQFGVDHPEVLSVDRTGAKQYMVWEYAYPEARKAKVSEFVQFAKQYGFRKFVACLRTEAAQMQPAPKHADQFGYNEPIVAEMKRRHGVDILTDKRFDFADPAFNLRDPMVEAWRTLRGEYLTQFYRELRAGLSAVDPAIEIAAQIPGERAGTCLGNYPLQWRTWIDEGLVNELVLGVALDSNEGYATTAAAEKAGYLLEYVDAKTARDFIAKSKQPTARVIQAGGPAVRFDTVPPDALGWRIDQWFDLWCYNQADRWRQWRADFAEFGHIRYIHQSFDDMPEGRDGLGGGYGDFCHRPDLRACPGYWERIGDGSNDLPHAQSKVVRSGRGKAIKLTRAADASTGLQARHHGRPDRSWFPFQGDTAISSGTCEWSFWFFRPDANSSFVCDLNYVDDATTFGQVGFYVPPGEAAAIYLPEQGKWQASTATVPIGQWMRAVTQVDLEAKTFSIDILSEDGKSQSVCRDKAYVSTINAFNKIDFAPQGETGNVHYIDDVDLRWMPKTMFAREPKTTLVDESWDSIAPGTAISKAKGWTLVAGKPSDVIVDRDVSFGDGYHSLRFLNQAGRARFASEALKASPADTLVLDVDVLLRSEQTHVQLTPPAPAGGDRTSISVVDRTGKKPLLEVAAIDGKWHVGVGGKLEPTEIAADSDCWHHLQIAMSPTRKKFRVLTQALAAVPQVVREGALDAWGEKPIALAIELACQREKTRPDGPAFDNLRVGVVGKERSP